MIRLAWGIALVCLLFAAPTASAQEEKYQGKTIKEWTGLLKNPDPRVRFQAVQALGEAGLEATPAIEGLAKLLKDPHPAVRRASAQVLAAMGEEAAPVVPALTNALRDADPGVRYYAAEALSEIGAKAVPPLIEALKDKDAQVRALAAYALDGLGSAAREAAGALGVALKDPNVNVRRAALAALVKLGPMATEALPALGEGLKDKELSFRVTAAMALLSVGKEGQAELVKAAAEVQPGTRLTAIQALSSIEKEELDPDSVKAICTALDDADAKVRQAAASGVAGLGTRARQLGGDLNVVKALFARLGDKEIGVRRMAVVALGQVGLDDEADLTRLAEGFKDKDFGVRYFTVQALAQYNTEETPAALKQAILGHIAAGLADKDRRVQYAAGQLLVQEAAQSIPALIKQLDKAAPPGKIMAALVLGEIGAAAADAVPALEKLKKEGNAEVRQAAALALKKIKE